MFYKLYILTNLQTFVVLLCYIYIVDKIIKKREQSIMFRFCDACNLTSKNNDKLTRYLIRYQVI